MATETIQHIYDQFMAIMEEGDQDKALAFIKENWNNFPEKLQNDLTMSFFEDALLKEAKESDAITGIQKEGMEAMSSLEKTKRHLEDALKAENIRSSLVS